MQLTSSPNILPSPHSEDFEKTSLKLLSPAPRSLTFSSSSDNKETQSNFQPFHKDERAKEDMDKGNMLRIMLKTIKLQGTKRNKPESKRIKCNCKKTGCLKMYCDCFKLKGYCEDCNCTSCMNTPQFEEARVKAMKGIRARNPLAFRRVLKEKVIDELDNDNPCKNIGGCNCKKSNCSKKYCECFQMGIPCGSNCACISCHNIY